jgi:hypothetical protein
LFALHCVVHVDPFWVTYRGFRPLANAEKVDNTEPMFSEVARDSLSSWHFEFKGSPQPLCAERVLREA